MNKVERQIVEWMRVRADRGERAAVGRAHGIDLGDPVALINARRAVAALEEIAILRTISDEIEAGKHRGKP